jgi:hypothetical protein
MRRKARAIMSAIRSFLTKRLGPSCDVAADQANRTDKLMRERDNTIAITGALQDQIDRRIQLLQTEADSMRQQHHGRAHGGRSG